MSSADRVPTKERRPGPAASIWRAPVTSSPDDRRLQIGLYLTAVFLFWFAQYVFVPILPTYLESKTTNLGVVGFALSMYGLWQAVIRLPLGIVCDWVGSRKPFILVGLALSGAGAWVMLWSSGVEGIAVGRAITGLAAGSWVLLVVGFSALFPSNQVVQASALLTLFNSLGRIVATSITAPLNNSGGYPLVFSAAIVVSLLSVLTLLPLRAERLPARRPTLGSLRPILLRRDVVLPSILSALGQYVNWGISFGFLVVLVQQLGGDSLAQGGIVTLHIAMHALGSLIASIAAQRLGNKRLLYASFAMLAVGALVAALSNSVAMLFVAPVFLGLGMGTSYPILMGMSIRDVAETERMTAMGLHQSIYPIGMFVGPAVSGVFADHVGIQSMFALTGLALLGAAWGLIMILQDEMASRK